MVAILNFQGQFSQFLKSDISGTDTYLGLKFGMDSNLHIMKLYTKFGENPRGWVTCPCCFGMEWPDCQTFVTWEGHSTKDLWLIIVSAMWQISLVIGSKYQLFWTMEFW